MELRIISTKQAKSHTIAWLELETPNGNFVIQPGHAPMITSLSPKQPITFRLKNGKQETITPQAGVAEITRDKATLLISE